MIYLSVYEQFADRRFTSSHCAAEKRPVRLLAGDSASRTQNQLAVDIREIVGRQDQAVAGCPGRVGDRRLDLA